MAVEYEHALGVCVGDRYRDTAEAVHPGITTDPAWPSVAQRLHQAEAGGWQVADILQSADRMGDYANARSETSVLVFRLDRLLARTSPDTDTDAPVPTWLAARPPAGASPPWDRYLPARYAEMDQRITALGAEAGRQRMPWLGGVGEGEARGLAIRQTVAYRAVYAVSGDDPIGPEPDRRGRQNAAWTAAHRAIKASHHTENGPPAASRLLGLLATTTVTDDDRPADTRSGPTLHH